MDLNLENKKKCIEMDLHFTQLQAEINIAIRALFMNRLTGVFEDHFTKPRKDYLYLSWIIGQNTGKHFDYIVRCNDMSLR